MSRIFIVLAAILALAAPARAASWTIDTQKSRLGFTGLQGTAAFEGSFKKFDASISLDPDQPGTGTITAIIDIASITAGSAERDAYLPQPDWFDTSKFPQAKFASTRITKTSDHNYEAQGSLTIKNVTKPVTLAFSLKPEQGQWHAQGHAQLMRNDFLIGTGTWSSEDYVKHAVTVSFDIWAKPQS